MASHKIRRLAALLCVCLLVCGTQAWAGEVRLYHGGASCYVSDMAEGDGTLYYMLTDRETGYQSSIFARAVDGMTAGITYAPDSYEPLAGLHFLHMEPASTGALWAALWDGRANYCVAVLHHGALAAVQPCDTKPCLGDGAAVWQVEDRLLCWDGSRVREYTVPAGAAADQVSLWQGRPAFADFGSGSVTAFVSDTRTETLFRLPEGQRFTYVSLAAAEDELYLSYWAESGDGAEKSAATVRLSDGKQLDSGAFSITQARTQGDGSVRLLCSSVAPVVGPGSSSELYQLTVTEKDITLQRVATLLLAEGTLQPDMAGYRFVDSAGVEWVYGLGGHVEHERLTEIRPDGTVVRSLSGQMNALIHWAGAAVQWGTEPYITGTGSTMVPVRELAALLGAEVRWDAGERAVSLQRDGVELRLRIGSREASINGEAALLPSAAELRTGSTMVPLRFVAETFGGTVRWEHGAVHVDLPSQSE